MSFPAKTGKQRPHHGLGPKGKVKRMPTSGGNQRSNGKTTFHTNQHSEAPSHEWFEKL